jgi:predicted nucleic acid-binding protein
VAMQQEILDLATEYVRTYRLSHGLALPDAIIGATAIYYRIPLYTYNTKDFKFLPDIQLTTFSH